MVGVLRGGPSVEYEVSLQSGSAVLRSLRERLRTVDLLLDKKGEWYRGGVPVSPARALAGLDVVFNALHGRFGEDGKLQRLLETLRVPYTGSAVLPSAIGMKKTLAKERFRALGFKTPRSAVLRAGEDLSERIVSLFRTSPMPAVVKPISGGSSIGVSLAHTLSELEVAVAKALAYGDSVLVEEYIRGEEVTCGVVERYRGQEVYPLFPVVIKPQGRFYDFDSKYKGRADLYCPAPLPAARKREVEALAVAVHKGLDLRHYSRIDCIISSSRGVYLLEVNTLPGLYVDAPMTKALEATGFPLPDFAEHILSLALNSERR